MMKTWSWPGFPSMALKRMLSRVHVSWHLHLHGHRYLTAALQQAAHIIRSG